MDNVKTALVTAVIVLLILIAGGGWFFYALYQERKELLEFAGTSDSGARDEVTVFERSINLMHTALGLLTKEVRELQGQPSIVEETDVMADQGPDMVPDQATATQNKSATLTDTVVIPIEPQTYGPCGNVGDCVFNILLASYPLDAKALENNIAKLGDLVQFERGDRRAARELNDKGLQAFRLGNYGLAADIFMEAAQLDPGDIEIAANYGFALTRSGNIDKASSALADALILGPRRTATWTPVAEFFSLVDDFDSTVRSLLVAYYYSRHPQTTYRFYADRSQTAPNEKLRRGYRGALNVIDSASFGFSPPSATR